MTIDMSIGSKGTVRRSAFIVFLSAFLILIPFDGLFRVIALKTNTYLINGWKDAFLIAILYFGFIVVLARGKDISGMFRISHPIETVGLITLGLFGIGIGLALNSITLFQGLWGFKVLYLPIFLFIIAQIYSADMNADFPTRIIKLLLFVSIPIVLFGIWQFFTGWENVSRLFLDKEMQGISYVEVITIGNYLRAFSTLRDPFAFGDFCSMLFIFNTAILLFSKNRKMMHISIGLILFFGSIVSTNRICIINEAVGAIFLVFLNLPFKKEERKGLFILLFVCIIFSASLIGYYLAYHFKPPSLKNQFIESLTGTTSMLPRFIEWKRVLMQYPFNDIINILFGWGTGVVGAAQARFTPHYLFVDNLYLLILIMHGYLGLLIWLIFLGKHLSSLLNFVVNKMNVPYADYWFIAGTTVFLITKYSEFLFRTSLELYPGQIYFWVFLGLAMRAIRMHKHTPVNEPT